MQCPPITFFRSPKYGNLKNTVLEEQLKIQALPIIYQNRKFQVAEGKTGNKDTCLAATFKVPL